jgi:glutamyl-tRNA reductase
MATLPAPRADMGGVRRLVDIAVPRNIHRDAGELDTVTLYNVDDLKEVVDQNKEARAQAAEEALVLLEQERVSFEAWRDSLETVPTIKKLRAKAEAIRTAEVDKALKALGGAEGLNKKQRKAIEELSRGITNKLLHGPMQSLRSDGTDAQSVSATLINMHSLEAMFDLASVDAEPSNRDMQGAGALEV